MLGSSRAWTAMAWAIASSVLSRAAPSAACLVRQDVVWGCLPAFTGNEALLSDMSHAALMDLWWPQVCPGLESWLNPNLRPW